MTPEELVPSLTTCRQLNEAGFPQDTHFGWFLDIVDGYVVRTPEAFEMQQPDYAAPTAAELLEALHKQGWNTVEVKGRAWAPPETLWQSEVDSMADTHIDTAATPAEALALLWLKIKETKP